MTYPGIRTTVSALDEVSLGVEVGESVAVMGPSGGGKSTLLAILGLLFAPTHGQIMFDGEPVPESRTGRARLRNAGLGYLHQDFAVIEDETVLDNVTIPLLYARPRVDRLRRRRRAIEAAEQVGLGWALDERGSRLSGGERQRVAIARALVNDPRLVLADEPTAALDTDTAAQILTQLLAPTERGGAVVIATHDPRVAERCDRVVLIRDGVVVRDAGDSAR